MYRVRQVAERINVSISTIYELIKRGDLECHCAAVRKGFRISEEQLQKYMERSKVNHGNGLRSAPRPKLRNLTL